MTSTALFLAACGHSPSRRAPSDDGVSPGRVKPAASVAVDPCAPTRTHHDSDYTAGGLYAPGVSDSGPSVPIDISALVEPVPREEPRSRYGNRSPYVVLGKSYRVLDSAEGYAERGIASWYGNKFNGRATSSGEIYDMCSFTAAHKSLPLPSFARVTHLDNGRSVVVRVNDRGPFHDGRLIDLSYAAAVRLGVDRTGTARVEVRAITSSEPDRGPASSVDTAVTRPVNVDRAAGPSLVQVGSFAEKDNAKRLAERLENADIDDIDLDRAEVDGRTVWRVQVGPVEPARLAALLDSLRALGLSDLKVLGL